MVSANEQHECKSGISQKMVENLDLEFEVLLRNVSGNS